MKKGSSLRCSGAFRVDFEYYYEMISIFHLCQLSILGVRGCQEKYEAISLAVFRLARTKSIDQIASSEGLSGVNCCGQNMGQALSSLDVSRETFSNGQKLLAMSESPTRSHHYKTFFLLWLLG